MSEQYDYDFAALMALDEQERRTALGEHIISMIDAPARRKEEQTHAFMDLIARAKQADQGEKG